MPVGRYDIGKMYRFISHLKFLFTATNQHGVHSPFVYNYVTKCLYAKSEHKASKSLGVLLKSIPYFSVKNIKIVSENQKTIDRIQQKLNVTLNKNRPYDLIYVAHPTANPNSILKQIHNDTMVLVADIHQNKSSSKRWEAFKQCEQARVSIDLFHCGILFFRKQQAKEHFKIRI